jgi:hypothetical protein
VEKEEIKSKKFPFLKGETKRAWFITAMPFLYDEGGEISNFKLEGANQKKAITDRFLPYT